MPWTSRNGAARARTFLAGQCAPRASTAGPLTKPGPVETRTRPIDSTPRSPVTRHSPEAVRRRRTPFQGAQRKRSSSGPSRYGPMICTPIGRPLRARSIGAAVAGRPHVPAGSAHTKHASRYGCRLPSMSSAAAQPAANDPAERPVPKPTGRAQHRIRERTDSIAAGSGRAPGRFPANRDDSSRYYLSFLALSLDACTTAPTSTPSCG
jgi:hypothetical protein